MNKILITMVKKELLSSLRDRNFILFTAIFYLLILVSALGGYKNYRNATSERQKAAREFRQEWEEQNADPHSAAHFGTYLFKPFTFLSLYDPGLNSYTGTSYRVEAHKQHEVNYANVRDRDVALRFGELSFSLIFQVLVPLLIIFSVFSSITKEKENNTLRMMLAQGLRVRQVLWGKLTGNYLLVLLIVTPVFLGMLASLPLSSAPAVMLPRLLGFIGIYLLYFFIICGLVIIISALSSTSGAALLKGLGVWITICILLPRISASITDKSYKLPSRYNFNQNVLMGFTGGLQGDSNYVVRGKAFEKQILKKYGVDSVRQLPFNLRGLALQNSEDYNTKVYLLYASGVEAKIRDQQKLFDLFGFINPVISVKQLSMGFAGTDYQHHIDFHHRARSYRDSLVRALNLHLAYGQGKKRKNEGPEFFRSFRDFKYQMPAAASVWAAHRASFISLLLWTLVVAVLTYPVAKRIKLS